MRSLQPPDILWIHWRVYNFIVNTSKGVLFLPSSDAYVRSFLYLLYTLIKLYYTKKNLKKEKKIKSRDITLPTKFHPVKAMIFPVVMYGCQSCAIKKAECRRIDAVELWYWRRLLRVPWTTRRSKQSILKEISPDYSLEGLMMKLKLQ